MDDFVIAHNPDADSSLPYLLRLPIGRDGVVLKARDTWPRTAKVFCHPSQDWSAASFDELRIVERVPVRTCERRGAAIDLVLDRGRENRSQFVFGKARGRDVIFWQTARTAKQARPSVQVPTRRAAGQQLEIVVDSHERYAWKFTEQQATTVKGALLAGDYGIVHDGELVASVERKSLADLSGTLSGGKLRYLMAALASLPRAALVVEDRYSQVFKSRYVKPGVFAEGLAEAQVRFPRVPIVFCETRQLAQEWTYRFLGAALVHHLEDVAARALAADLPAAGAPLPRREPTPAELRSWAIAEGITISAKGRIPAAVVDAWRSAHPD